LTLPTPEQYFERIHKIVSQLDEMNVKIINAMKKNGPRNLQKIAQIAGLKYPTTYSRISKLEDGGLLATWAQPNFSKLGLSRAIVYVTPMAGMDALAREALKVPGYWLRVTRCMGESNGYFSIHAVPTANRQDFQQYLDHLTVSGIAQNYRVYWTGEQYTMVPNFDYYDAKLGKWRFEWDGWLKKLADASEGKAHKTSASWSMPVETAEFDERDLVILKELMKNGRVKLAELAKIFGVTLPAAKYRFDNIKKRGLIHEYVLDILPYAPDVSDLYEVRMDFKSEALMRSRAEVLGTLPFVLNYVPLRGSNSLSVRVYLPRGEMSNLITLLSTLARIGVLTNFTYVWLDYTTIQAQTFAYKDYTKRNGWHYDNRVYMAKLDGMLENMAKVRGEAAVFQPMSPITA